MFTAIVAPNNKQKANGVLSLQKSEQNLNPTQLINTRDYAGYSQVKNNANTNGGTGFNMMKEK